MHWKPGSWILIGVLLAAFTIAAPAQIATTQVADTIYHADGTAATGTVLLSWPAFTTSSGESIPSGSTSATIAAGGALSVRLISNAGATPIGGYYTAVYHLDDGSVSRQYWVVPASVGTVKVSAIESTVLPTSVAMQTVSKAYVDTAIAAATTGYPLDSTPYVLKAGDAMTGPLVLPADPVSPAQAADKNYVDATVAAVTGGLGQKVATQPQATQVVTQPAGTQLDVNHLNGVLYASQFVTGRGNNGIANAAAGPDCAAGCEIAAQQDYTTEPYSTAALNSQTHIRDTRGGRQVDSYLNPLDVVNHSLSTAQTIDAVSTQSEASLYQQTGNPVPGAMGLVINQQGLAGGSNLFPEEIGSVPYFKMGYSALTVNGTYNTQGQHVLAPQGINCYGVGDCLMGSRFLTASGGFRDSADEGAHPFDLQSHEDSKVFVGTCTTGCTAGSTSVNITPTAGPGTQGDGRFLIDTNPAKAITSASTGGALISGSATGPHASAQFSGTSFPASVFLSTGQAIPPQASDIAPGTVTFAIATTGVPAGYATSTAAIGATSGLACLSDQTAGYAPDNYEMAPYTVIDATHLQMTFNKPHQIMATLAFGGLCGYGLEQTVDTANGIRQLFPVIGATSATSLYYAGGSTPIVGAMNQTSGFLNMSASIATATRAANVVTVTTTGNLAANINGLAVTIAGVADSSYNGTYVVTTTGANAFTYAQSGANSTTSGGTASILTGGFALYPMAEVLSVFNPATKSVDGQMTLARNNVAWAANDPVEEPHFYQENVSADVEYVGQSVPRPTTTLRAGLQYQQNNGPGLVGWSIANAAPATNYLGYGGTHGFPDAAYEASGLWRRTMNLTAGEQAVFAVHCNLHGCGNWNSTYDLFELDSNVSADLVQYAPASSSLSMILRGTPYSFTPQAFTAGTINVGTLNATTINGQVSGAAQIVPGALADYIFSNGSGSVLSDQTGNGNDATLGSGAAAPAWLGTGLAFGVSGTASTVALPTSLNGAQTFFFAAYINPVDLANMGASGSGWETLAASTQSDGGGLYLGIESPLLGVGTFSPWIKSSAGYNSFCKQAISGFHVIAWQLGAAANGTLDRTWIDGVECPLTAASQNAGVQTSGHLTLGASGVGIGATGFEGTYYRAIFYPGHLTDAQMQTMSGLLANQVAQRGVPTSPANVPLQTPQLHAIGDSITYGLDASFAWPSTLSLVRQSYTVNNWGIPGMLVAAAAGSEPNRVGARCMTSAGPSVAIVFAGTNDFVVMGNTRAQVVSSYASEVQTLKRSGCQVFVATMLSRNYGGTNWDATKDTFDEQLLSQSRAIGADGVVDFAADPNLGADGAYASTTWFADQTHPTSAGQTRLGQIASNALNYYFGYTFSQPHVVTDNTYTLTSADTAVTAAPTANAAYILPDCTGPSGGTYTIMNPQSAYTLTIQGEASQPINGLASAIAIPANSNVTLRDVPNPKAISGCHWAM